MPVGMRGAFGLNVPDVIGGLQARNAVVATAVIQARPEQVGIRAGSAFTSENDLAEVNFRLNDRVLRASEPWDRRGSRR